MALPLHGRESSWWSAKPTFVWPERANRAASNRLQQWAFNATSNWFVNSVRHFLSNSCHATIFITPKSVLFPKPTLSSACRIFLARLLLSFATHVMTTAAMMIINFIHTAVFRVLWQKGESKENSRGQYCKSSKTQTGPSQFFFFFF